ncbi:MAG: FeoB-associated Cys-rich membrane protein [Flavobacteriaceae bacterium]|nr:FeoB-associated Cys-rich membrane protein [Flavobacteriaceae bacterium]
MILVLLTFILAVGYLIRKFLFKKKSKSACGKDQCGC